MRCVRVINLFECVACVYCKLNVQSAQEFFPAWRIACKYDLLSFRVHYNRNQAAKLLKICSLKGMFG